MVIPLTARLSTKLLFPVLAWTFNPTSTGKGNSFFVEWQKFYIFSLLFLFTLLKRISCAILVDILCRLVDKLRLKSNIILMSFISISGTDCTCLPIDTSPSKHSSFSNNLILIALAVSEKTRVFHLTTYTQHKVPVQLHHQQLMLLLSTFLCNTKTRDFLLHFFPHSSCMGVSNKSNRIN